MMVTGMKKWAHCMNLSAALEPQGNFNGRSKVLPKSTSSAEMGRRKRPVYVINPHSSSGKYKIQIEGPTLNLYAPSNALSILAVEILALQHISFFVCEVFNIGKNLPFKDIGHNGVWHIRID
jgi:hypothetical protein